MAIALDSSAVAAWATNLSSQTLAHTVSGSNTILLVFVHFASTGSPSATVTYAGSTMTVTKSDFTYVTSNGGAACFHLVNPTTGTNNIVVTVTGTTTTTNLKVTSVSLNGAAQSVPEASTLTKTLSTSAPANVTTITDNAWVITSDVVDANDSLTTPVGYTAITNNGTATSTVAVSAVAYKGPVTPPGAQTISWLDSTSDNNMTISLSVAPAAGGAAVIPFLMLLGVGV